MEKKFLLLGLQLRRKSNQDWWANIELNAGWEANLIWNQPFGLSRTRCTSSGTLACTSHKGSPGIRLLCRAQLHRSPHWQTRKWDNLLMFVHKIGQACQGLEDLVFSHPSFHPLEFPLCHGSDSAPICWNFDIFSDYVINYSPNSRWPVPFTLWSQWAKKNPEKLEVPNHLTDPLRNLIQEIHYRVYRACKRNIYWEIGNCELIISQLNLWNSCLLIGNFGIVLSTTASPGACTGFKRPPAWVEPTEIFF